MLKNKIPLHVFVGINLLILSLFPFALVFTEFVRENRYSSSGDWIELAIVMAFAFGLLITGLSYWYRGSKSRVAMNIILIVLFCFVAVLLYFIIGQLMLSNRRFSFRSELLGAAVFLMTVPLGVFLFINNREVIEEMNKENQKR